jgi:hypothetical protein
MCRQSLYSYLRMAVVVTKQQVEKLSGTYCLEELMELNGLEEVDVMFILIQGGHCKIPNPRPVDYEQE